VESVSCAPESSPILVGGTGRSGSTVLGHILDHHPHLSLTRPMEVRFLAGRHGLAEALDAAQRDPDQAQTVSELAVDRLKNRWYFRAEEVGLHTTVARPDLDAWCDDYLGRFGTDPVGATRQLTAQIMQRVVAPLPGSRWVDTTPANARNADLVTRIYPNAQVVAVERDGRDVAASFVQQPFGPDDPFQALRKWEQRTLRIHQAAQSCTPGRMLIVQLMDLVAQDRAGTLQRICEFLNVPVDAGMAAWFDENVTADAAHPDRWRRQFDRKTADRLDKRYAQAVQRLRAEGVQVVT